MVEEIRVVMFGKTGVGKSSLGNNILNEQIFSAGGNAQSVTKELKRGERKIDDNYNLILVDTPGLFDTTTNDNMETAKILAKTVNGTKPGPHIFLFVLAIGRFTAEEKATVEFLKDLFGSHVTDYLIIVFTGKDTLDYDKKDLDTYIDTAGDDLKSIISQCKGKMAINNRSPEEVTKSVHSLIEMIKSVYLQNEKKHYTDELLIEAQAIFEEKLRQQEEEAHRRERELEAEMKQLEEDKDLIISQNKTEFKEYQERKEVETEKLQEDIKQNQKDLRQQKEEANKRERELEDKHKHLEEEKNRIIKQNAADLKEYQNKQELKYEKQQEDMRKEKEQYQKALSEQKEEANRRERELADKQKHLEEEKDSMEKQNAAEFKEYREKQELKYEEQQKEIKKIVEDSTAAYNKANESIQAAIGEKKVLELELQHLKQQQSDREKEMHYMMENKSNREQIDGIQSQLSELLGTIAKKEKRVKTMEEDMVKNRRELEKAQADLEEARKQKCTIQ